MAATKYPPICSRSSGPARAADRPKIEPSSWSLCSSELFASASADFAPASAVASRCMIAAAMRLMPSHTTKDTIWIDESTSPLSRSAMTIPLWASSIV